MSTDALIVIIIAATAKQKDSSTPIAEGDEWKWNGCSKNADDHKEGVEVLY
jgi:hypothetical protein